MRTILASSALVLAALSSGCASSVDTANAPTFGVANQQMRDAQTDPVAATSQAPEGSGAVGTLAQQRYKTGEIRPLAPASTSTTNNSSR